MALATPPAATTESVVMRLGTLIEPDKAREELAELPEKG
jgi:hypothetical protein